jgi:hypothetical protein
MKFVATKTADQLDLQALRIASEFGFTPASRSTISTPAKSEPSLFDLVKGPKEETDEHCLPRHIGT